MGWHHWLIQVASLFTDRFAAVFVSLQAIQLIGYRDSDGLVVVPQAQAERIAQAAEAVFADEEQRRTSIVASRTHIPA